MWAAKDLEARQRQWFAGELFARLIEMVAVKVAIAARPDEISDLEIALLRDHVRQQCIGGDVERHAQEEVGAALVQLAAEAAVGRDVELEQRVAGRQGHLVGLPRVPARDDQAPAGGVAADLLDDPADLVDAVVRVRAVGAARRALGTKAAIICS